MIFVGLLRRLQAEELVASAPSVENRRQQLKQRAKERRCISIIHMMPVFEPEAGLH